MLNNINIAGRLTRDPELRYTQNNVPVATFTVAVDRDFKKGDERETDFINVVAFRNNAEFSYKYLSKGSLVIVSGRLQTHKYTDNQGQNRVAYEVVCEHVYFAQSKQRLENGAFGVNVDAGGFEDMDDSDGDLPF